MGKSTYAAVGNKLDISDLISNITPDETPIYSMMGKATATATYHEWLEDTDPSGGANKKTEGFTYTVEDPGTRTRLGNYTQIMSRGYGVTETQEIVQKHGVKSEMAYQMAKAMKRIAKDVNYALINQTTQAAGDAETERQFGGIPYWISTNKKDNGGTPRVISETLVNDALQAAWESGGSPTMLFVSPGQKRKISALTDSATKYMTEGTTKIGSRIDVFESDFGVLKVVIDRMLPDTDAYLIDPSLWKVAFLRPFKTIDLPKVSDMEKKVIVGELSLEARSEAANARIADLKLA